MEDNNYRDDFEHFLKENSDEFRMVPYRKVWYSIYNNMHPARRWPSIAVCLLILLAVSYIGIENNNSLSNAARKNASQTLAANLFNKKADKNIPFLPTVIENLNTTNNNPNIAQITTVQTLSSSEDLNIALQQNDNSIVAEQENTLITLATLNKGEVSSESQKLNTDLSLINKSKASKNNDVSILKEKADEVKNIEKSLTNQQTTAEILGGVENKIKADINTVSAKDKDLKSLLLTAEKSWKEDYAFRNKPAINKLKQNGSISYYFTPSIGYRNITKRTAAKPNSTNNFTGRNSVSGNTPLEDNPALNLELGASLLYTISENIRVKTGIQANYLNYTSSATSLGHPSQTALAVTNYSSVYGVSEYSSAPGSTKLNKTSIQVAVPIGADIKLAGKGNLKWYVGSTIQPTYLIKSSAYVLSSDGAYYASEPGLLRKLNLNTAIETFVSFKSSTGITMSVGPQFRYQVLSTYKNAYNYSEKLYNIGLKLGISTTF